MTRISVELVPRQKDTLIKELVLIKDNNSNIYLMPIETDILEYLSGVI